MAVLKRFLTMAARRAASDPEIQAKAAAIVRDEVAPRARSAAERARPHVEDAGRAARRAIEDVRGVAREHPPMGDPEGFGRALGERLRKRRHDDNGS